MPVLNGDWEVDAGGWVPLNGGTVVRQTTTAHTGSASANVTTGGAFNSGITAVMTGDAPQTSTWDCSGYLQAHGAGDVGRTATITLTGTGGTGETFTGPTITLAAGPGGWQLSTITSTFANAGHSAANVQIAQVGAGAAFNIDADTLALARHLAYLPSGDPLVTGLWFSGIPASNFACPSDATTAAISGAGGLYVGA